MKPPLHSIALQSRGRGNNIYDGLVVKKEQDQFRPSFSAVALERYITLQMID